MYTPPPPRKNLQLKLFPTLGAPGEGGGAKKYVCNGRYAINPIPVEVLENQDALGFALNFYWGTR